MSFVLSSSPFARVAAVVAVVVVSTVSLTVTHIVHADAPKTAADYKADPAAMLEQPAGDGPARDPGGGRKNAVIHRWPR